MDMRTCPICEARWIDGQHYWSTGRVGNPKDLASLVCNRFRNGRDGCINPMLGCEGGDTWEKRAGDLKAAEDRMGIPSQPPIDISYEHPYRDVPFPDNNFGT